MGRLLLRRAHSCDACAIFQAQVKMSRASALRLRLRVLEEEQGLLRVAFHVWRRGARATGGYWLRELAAAQADSRRRWMAEWQEYWGAVGQHGRSGDADGWQLAWLVYARCMESGDWSEWPPWAAAGYNFDELQ